MARYALTIFVSAFLLFQVQPLVGKYVLPWFGGTPNVWNTCMLFFQLLLLGGYAYAHAVAKRLSRKQQGMLHLGLLAFALVMLTVFFPPWSSMKPSGDSHPAGQILLLLLVSVGVPYLTLSATGPLLQSWFSLTHPGRSPYRLYALSNIGSLLALISYPFVFEPSLTLPAQAWWWSAGYALFAASCGFCAWALYRSEIAPSEKLSEVETAAKAKADAEPVASPRIGDILLWLGLSACGSSMLLATTNQLCIDVAVVPFLWVLPLSLYLVTFIICFDNEEWYSRSWFSAAFLAAAMAVLVVLKEGVGLSPVDFDMTRFGIKWQPELSSLTLQILVYCFTLFTVCMMCHGELVHLKPHPKHLTLFFLMVSLGGAMGGLLVSIVAPMVLDGYWEFHFCLGSVVALMLLVVCRDLVRTLYGKFTVLEWSAMLLPAAVCVGVSAWLITANSTHPEFFEWLDENPRHWRGFTLLMVGATIGLIYFLWSENFRWAQATNLMVALAALGGLGPLVVALDNHISSTNARSIDKTRNFYGVLRVITEDTGEDEKLTLMHGRINHGFQFRDAEKRLWHTSYYADDAGPGVAILHHPRRLNPPGNMRIGVIGLGTGTMASYAEKGDYIRFYDINPEVVRLSDKHFTYRADAAARGADVGVFMGDARLVMERQLVENQNQQFDVLVVDAFSSDAIPVHLLTVECAEIYWQHLRPGGILAIHISNRYLNLIPPVKAIAREYNKKVLRPLGGGLGLGLRSLEEKGLTVNALWIDSYGDNSKGTDGANWILLTKNREYLENKDIWQYVNAWSGDTSGMGIITWTDDYTSIQELLTH